MKQTQPDSNSPVRTKVWDDDRRPVTINQAIRAKQLGKALGRDVYNAQIIAIFYSSLSLVLEDLGSTRLSSVAKTCSLIAHDRHLIARYEQTVDDISNNSDR